LKGSHAEEVRETYFAVMPPALHGNKYQWRDIGPPR
jgi:hypothetical protein